jgi:hypothetical protein
MTALDGKQHGKVELTRGQRSGLGGQPAGNRVDRRPSRRCGLVIGAVALGEGEPTGDERDGRDRAYPDRETPEAPRGAARSLERGVLGGKGGIEELAFERVGVAGMCG